MNNEQFDISKLMNEISPQFDKVVKELGNTIDVIGKVIKENAATSSSTSSVDIPSTGDSETNKETPEVEKSTLTLKDMKTLLDVNDTLDELDEALTVIVGDAGIGSNGLIRKLDKIISVIVNASVAKESQEDVDNPNEWIYELLDDKTIDNERKARMLLGLER